MSETKGAMESIFPEPILGLPKADIPLEGLNAYLVQGENHQVIFMQFDKAVTLPEHSHAGQWGIVLEGKIELTIGGVTHMYVKGDRYYIPPGTPHWGRIFAGYADMTFFDQKDRYQEKME